MVEPVSITLICIMGTFLVINLYLVLKPEYDEWQRRRRAQTRQKARLRYDLGARGQEFRAITRFLDQWLRGQSSLHAINALMFSIQGDTRVYIVPDSAYPVPVSYGRHRFKLIALHPEHITYPTEYAIEATGSNTSVYDIETYVGLLVQQNPA